MLNYYKRLDYQIEPDILNSILEFLPNAIWSFSPAMAHAPNFAPLAADILKRDALLGPLAHYFNGELAFYKFPSESFYHFHKDYINGCALNMVFEYHTSHTLFKIGEDFHNGVQCKTHELIYEPRQWYVFNTQMEHCVMNYGDKARILFTLRMPMSVTYQNVLDYLDDHNIT